MSGEITFLPSLRRGLAAAIGAVDPLTGPLTRGPSVTGWVEVEGERADHAVRLRGPDAATGLAPGQVLRVEPRADSGDVEPNYFPLVELAAPDLPWMLTPARADGQGRLRPWLVLVCVREQEGVSLTTRAETPLPVLRIEDPAAPRSELPDLDDSWAWAHVQSLVATEDVEGAVSGATGEVIARIVCPRRLLPNAPYLCCLVPAFAAGVARGLGADPPAGDALQPAWRLAGLESPVELPAYHHWRFATGPAGDFEDLCRRLQPDGDGADMGRHAMDIRDPGILPAAPAPVLLDMDGALETPGVRSRPWPKGHKDDFQPRLVDLVDGGAARTRTTPPKPGAPYDPLTQDPVVAPPLYGAWPAGLTAVPAKGWAQELNADPVRRGAAGLGALAVRTRQEELVAAAWDQAGDLRETISALNRGRLAAEVGRSWARRASALPDPDLLQLTARLHAFMPDGASTVRARLVTSAVPAGLVSATYARQTRPGGTLSRDWRKRRGAAPAARMAPEVLRTTLQATRTGLGTSPLDFAVARIPDGAQVADATLPLEVTEPVFQNATRARIAAIERRTRRRRPAARTEGPSKPWDPGGDVIDRPLPTTDDVSGIAGAVRRTIDPLPSVRANVTLRIPALEGLIGAGELPTMLALGPVFEDPLSVDLIALGAPWLLPGVESMDWNRVRLVAENPEFIGSLMIGATHEMARELLWRGYPVNLRATFFRRFWSYVADPDRTDIEELLDWGEEPKVGQSLAKRMGGAAETSTVMVVRGDIVRRYPTASYYLQPAVLKGDVASPVANAVVPPMFIGAIDRDTVFFGFDVPPREVVGERDGGVAGHFLVIEEQAGAPRLGLDEPDDPHYGEAPASWDELSWGHLADDADALEALTHAPAEHDRLARVADPAATWGRNAAHQARACWQRPFRMLIHADDLI